MAIRLWSELTQFEYSKRQISTKLTDRGRVKISLEVKNVGQRERFVCMLTVNLTDIFFILFSLFEVELPKTDLSLILCQIDGFSIFEYHL